VLRRTASQPGAVGLDAPAIRRYLCLRLTGHGHKDIGRFIKSAKKDLGGK